MRHSQLCSIRCSCEKTMAGHQSENNLKRGPDDLYEFHPPQLRPAKFSRQTLGDDVGSSADHSVDVDMLGPGGRVSLGKKAKPDASMHDSTDAGLGFNCTALAEVLQSEEFLAAEDMKEAPLADVYMRRGAKYARISWNCMLTQITKRLKLKMHDYGYLHMEGTGAGVEAWIRVEVPVKSEVPTKKVEKFFGNHSCCRYDALESACKAAVRFLRRECDVIILDANYGEMKAMEKRAKMEEDFSNMYVDMIAARDKHEAVMHAHYASIFSTAKGICKEFRDVFPVMVEDVAVPSTSASEMKIAYAGPRPPITRIDQFAHALVDVLHKGCDLGIACRNVM